jgi:hypothetical protein
MGAPNLALLLTVRWGQRSGRGEVLGHVPLEDVLVRLARRLPLRLRGVDVEVIGEALRPAELDDPAFRKAGGLIDLRLQNAGYCQPKRAAQKRPLLAWTGDEPTIFATTAGVWGVGGLGNVRCFVVAV